MPDLAFPSSGGVLEAFIERIRYSPKAKVDIDWLAGCLGISQRTNAGRTLNWLRAIGVIDSEGSLTTRGLDFLVLPSSRRYRRAAFQSLSDVVGGDRAIRELKERKITRGALRRELLDRHDVGPSSINKAIVGMYVLAEAAGEHELAQLLGRTGFQPHEPVAPVVDIVGFKAEILQRFALFTGETGGIDGWLNPETPDVTFERLVKIPIAPLTSSQFNQLLTLAHAAPVSKGFFQYYWLTHAAHPYDLTSVPSWSPEWDSSLAIFHLDQLYWGLYRFYVDALLYFGNIRSAYQILRTMSYQQLTEFFEGQMFNATEMTARGPSLFLHEIKRDDRYLISEMACKSYEPDGGVGLEEVLTEAYLDYKAKNDAEVTAGFLLGDKGEFVLTNYASSQTMFKFAADEILDEPIESEEHLRQLLFPIKQRFSAARELALKNTELYLSSVGDLDLYVATSMRTRSDFHKMTDFCERAFKDRRMIRYHLRYFDPTLSAAANHQDKGLIECLMVKCAKVLVYTAGEKDSYGKDAEAAMALSLGKPVIFFCDTPDKLEFYRDVHPLSRLVDFQTGVAVGSMVTASSDTVVELLDRTFTNSMQYSLELEGPGYFVLKERLTDCVVRLQTNDGLVRETFWNHYHGTR